MSQQSYLYYLSALCDNPRLDKRTETLAGTVRKFCEWLDTECVVDGVWLAEIGIKVDVKATRLELFVDFHAVLTTGMRTISWTDLRR